MADFNERLQELKKKIVYEFDTYKDFNDYGEANNITYKDLDYLLFKVKCQIDQMKNDNISGKILDESTRAKDVELQKAEIVIKLQSLLSLITCNVINLDKKL